MKIKKVKIKSITPVGNEDVYDLTVSDNNNFIGNNIVVHNCGEIVLCPNDSCRLLSINLYSYVKNPFTKNAEFDYELFEKHVKIAQRLMDDLIDIELEKVNKIINKIKKDPESEEIKRTELNLWKKIKNKCELGRRTGLGITAEGDMLAGLNIRYGTKKGNLFSENIHMKLKHFAYESSCQMAKDRGSFPIWDAEREKKNPFMLRIKNENPKLYKELIKYGRRNIALLTIAPTGCLGENSVIKTDRGLMSLKDIFELNNILISDLRNQKKLWFDCTEDLSVYDINGNFNKVNKLYWNGLCDGYEFEFSDKTSQITSNTHKFLVLISENKAIWKTTKELKEGDNIVKLK